MRTRYCLLTTIDWTWMILRRTQSHCQEWRLMMVQRVTVLWSNGLVMSWALFGKSRTRTLSSRCCFVGACCGSCGGTRDRWLTPEALWMKCIQTCAALCLRAVCETYQVSTARNGRRRQNYYHRSQLRSQEWCDCRCYPKYSAYVFLQLSSWELCTLFRWH